MPKRAAVQTEDTPVAREAVEHGKPAPVKEATYVPIVRESEPTSETPAAPAENEESA